MFICITSRLSLLGFGIRVLNEFHKIFSEVHSHFVCSWTVSERWEWLFKGLKIHESDYESESCELEITWYFNSLVLCIKRVIMWINLNLKNDKQSCNLKGGGQMNCVYGLAGKQDTYHLSLKMVVIWCEFWIIEDLQEYMFYTIG